MMVAKNALKFKVVFSKSSSMLIIILIDRLIFELEAHILVLSKQENFFEQQS